MQHENQSTTPPQPRQKKAISRISPSDLQIAKCEGILFHCLSHPNSRVLICIADPHSLHRNPKLLISLLAHPLLPFRSSLEQSRRQGNQVSQSTENLHDDTSALLFSGNKDIGKGQIEGERQRRRPRDPRTILESYQGLVLHLHFQHVFTFSVVSILRSSVLTSHSSEPFGSPVHGHSTFSPVTCS